MVMLEMSCSSSCAGAAVGASTARVAAMAMAMAMGLRIGRPFLQGHWRKAGWPAGLLLTETYVRNDTLY
jgi:hypothetical protein